jgi:hypothetical protein
MSFPSIESNLRSRQRLEAVVSRLQQDDFAKTTDYGWTVSALLGHLAWWDQRVLVLLRHWLAEGLDESPVDSRAINEAIKPLCHALEPQAALALCLASAQETDALIEQLPAELIEAVERSLTHFRFDRSLHRDDHLSDIELLIGD